MNALVLHGAADLRCEPKWPVPEIPEGWALVKVAASGICGSDLPRILQTGAHRHPLIPGHEFAGTVAETRSTRAAVGQRVAVLPNIPCGQCVGCRIGPFHCSHYDFVGSRRDGGFAEYAAVPAANLFPLPDTVTAEQGAFLEPLSVALHVVRRSGMATGARVLVLGGGAIGILVAQWARLLGAQEVVLADLRDESLAVAQACGIGGVMNTQSAAFGPLAGFDVVFEAAGAAGALVAAIEKAAARGVVTVVGRDTKDLRVPLHAFETLMRKELELKGCWGYALHGDEELVHRVLQEGRLQLTPMITHRIGLPAGPETIARMGGREFFYCKVQFAP